jgi:molecular chaperone DnaK
VHGKARADGLVSDARAALDEDAPPERIRALTDELQQVYHSLGSGRADPDDRAGSGPAPAAADDDVVDAEFTVS